jgi:hypothetical protein
VVVIAGGRRIVRSGQRRPLTHDPCSRRRSAPTDDLRKLTRSHAPAIRSTAELLSRSVGRLSGQLDSRPDGYIECLRRSARSRSVCGGGLNTGVHATPHEEEQPWR